MPIQLPIRYRQVQRIGHWQLVAGCRFRFETDNISSTNRQLPTSCRLPIQLPIRYRQVQRIGNWQLVAGCRFRFETDNISSTNWQQVFVVSVADSVADSLQTSSTNRQLATSCRLPIQIRNNISSTNRQPAAGADSVADSI